MDESLSSPSLPLPPSPPPLSEIHADTPLRPPSVLPPNPSDPSKTLVDLADAATAPDLPPPAPSRLAIHSIVLHNFKSYGGTVSVGPFHKSFSAIVGPNGSGKSNVIDAMLFVFGRPAKHLRHSKLAELIHNSAALPDVQSATVTVYFHDIVDTGDGDEDFTVLPNSEFSVARTAYRNNTSKYFVDDDEVKRKYVVDLLKSKGVDLDNNRFLILQGEVEQISLMKAKATNAHDTGLLEYLEDIIGSNQHIVKIDETGALVESLNEERGHKLNRVKAAEKERDALENAKDEAEDYIDKERDMLGKKVTLNNAIQFDVDSTLRKHTAEHTDAKSKVDGFKSEVSEKEASVKQLEKSFKETQKAEGKAVKDLNAAKESYAAFERKDIKLREDMKALKAKDKKLKALITRERKRADENTEKVEQYRKQKEDAEKGIVKAESELDNAQKKFDKKRDEVRQKTQPIRERLEKKQAELLPFSETVNNASKDLQVNESNLQLIEERLAAPQKNYDDAMRSLEAISSELEQAQANLRSQEGERDAERRAMQDLEVDVSARKTRVNEMSSNLSSMRRRLEEARSARDFSSTRSKLHNSILAAARDRRLHGIVGRLGDLATVDDRYATAVSAAAGSNLDCIVVETAQNAQACIQFLRAENLGRATFIILEKVEYLRRPMDEWSRSNRSQDGQRLFDFLSIPQSQNRTAVYYSLRDTLVSNTLEEARRMAYKPTRKNRVVTLAGELIESTGSITGGGRAPTRYRLGSGRGSEGDMDNESFNNLTADVEKLRGEMQTEHHTLDELDVKKQSMTSHIEGIEITISKTTAEVGSLQSRLSNLRDDVVPNLRKVCDDAKKRIRNKTCEETRKRKAAEKAVGVAENALRDAKAACEDIEADIAKLQDDILKAGGNELEEVKGELEACRSRQSELQSEASTATSRAAAAEKAVKNAGDAAEKAANDRERVEVELIEARDQSEKLLDDAEDVSKKIKDAEQVHEEWSAKLKQIEAEYADVKGSLKSLRRKEVSLVEAADALDRLVEQDKHILSSLKKEGAALKKKIGKLSMMGLPKKAIDDEEGETVENGNDDDMEGEGDAMEQDGDNGAGKDDDKEERGENENDGDEEAQGQDVQMSGQEKKKLEAEIARLESDLASMNPNLSAIADYAQKDKEYLGQVSDLDEITKHRDDARRECDRLRKARLDQFMHGFSIITLKLKELYQMITLGGDAELELVDSLDPFSEGIVFSVRPPKKSWKNICNLSGGEKTLSSLALVFALHHFKPTPLYFLDEIDAALDFKNVSIVGNYVKERTKNAQFIIISLRNNMFELADRLVGIYKTQHKTKSVTVNPKAYVIPEVEMTRVTAATRQSRELSAAESCKTKA